MTAHLSTHKLRIALGGRPVLDGIDLDFAAGQLHGILGPNGCGKTTLIRVLCGALRPDEGHVLLNGQPVQSLSPACLARLMAVVWQGGQVSGDLTVRRLISYGRYAHLPWWRLNPSSRDGAVEDAMTATGVAHLAHRRVTSLSGGERQRVWIATALAQQPRVLLLDEPTTYLDIAHQLDVLELVRDLKERAQLTVICVLHDLGQAARFCDRCVVLGDGKIQADGVPTEALSAAQIGRTFAVDTWVTTDPEAGHPVIVPRRRLPASSSSSPSGEMP
ncbi:MAG: ABC transporter ATP-binding protein [Propionibacteriaceae bacterium]|nr:ABC transporter ATP-binding protein [Propionibacteriaceae bacterium]